jgi:thiamine biosynthesis lipoprotein
MNADDLLRRAQPWLGTLVEISCLRRLSSGETFSETRLMQACDAAFAVCQRIHNAMSAQLADSDISRFNSADAGTVITCDAWTLRVLRHALHIQSVTEGLFDIALGSSRQAFRILDATRLEKTGAHARLDAGGIAKGFAVDRMMATLRAHGIHTACVNAGGDLHVSGPESWPVYLRGLPDHETATLMLQQGSIASSVYANGESPSRHDLLVDPRHGRCSARTTAVSVAAPRCLHADALTKVIALSGNIHHPALAEFGAVAWMH